MSIRQTAVPLGGGIGALTLPWLASTVGFAWVCGWVALLCGVSAWLTWRWLHEPPAAGCAASPACRAPTGESLRQPGIWRIVAAIGLLCMPQFAVLTFASMFLHDFAHAGLGVMTATMVAVQGGAMAMRVWSGRWTDRHGNRRAYLRGCTLVSVAAFLVLAACVQGSAGNVHGLWMASASGDDRPRRHLRLGLARRGLCGAGRHGRGRARRHGARHGEYCGLPRLLPHAADPAALARGHAHGRWSGPALL